MNEIKCPNCGKVFQVDEAGYAAIVAQVHTEQFEKEIADRLKAAQRELEAKQQAAAAQEAGRYQQVVAQKDQEIARLQEQAKSLNDTKQKELEALRMAEEMRRSRELAEKEREITELRDSAKSFEQDKQLAVMTAVQKKDTEITGLRVQIEQEKQTAAGKLQSMEENHRHEVARLGRRLSVTGISSSASPPR